MDFFDEAALRLKQQLKVTEDKQAAEMLGMTGNAWTMRKRRRTFPEKELRALAQQRPELGIDVDYVVTGTTEQESLRQRDALHEAGGMSKSLRDSREAEMAVLAAWRKCAPVDQLLILHLMERVAERHKQ